MSRQSILDAVRAATGGATPLGGPPREPAPASLTTRGAEAIARFTEQARAKGVHVIAIADWNDLPKALAGAFTASGFAAHVRLAPAISASGVALTAWADHGLTAAEGPALPVDQIGVSLAFAGIAETGTLAVASDPSNPMTLAFMPEMHVAVVRRSAICGTFEEAIDQVRARYPEGLPRTLALISGASRTGDIGGRIVHGAHGPRHLTIVVVEND